MLIKRDLHGTSADNADSDYDGMPDGWEVEYGLDPLVDDADGDAEGDSISNYLENVIGTDPQNPDTDGNGISDYYEDADNDGMPNGWELSNGLNPLLNDSLLNIDGDGWSNYAEYKFGTDILDPDENGDGFLDGLEPVTGSVSQIYKIVPLGTLGGAASYAYAINEMNQVVGCGGKEDGTVNAFVYTDGQMLELPMSAGSTGSCAYDINEFGEIVGQTQNDTGSQAVYYNFTNNVTILEIPDNPAESAAVAINDAGQLVGWYKDGYYKRAFAFSPNYQALHESIPEGAYSNSKTANDINNAGIIVGAYPREYSVSAYLYDGAFRRIFGNMFMPSVPYAINARGISVGMRTIDDPYAVIYDYENSMLVPVSSFGDEFNESCGDWEVMNPSLYDVNNADIAVGSACVDYGTRHAGIVFPDSDHMLDLNDMFVVNDEGWIVHEARGVNDQGCIVGWATLNGSAEQAVLLLPVTDSDEDGLSDEDERHLYYTNPNNPDTDGDGMPDGWEISNDLNPRAENATSDEDRDRRTNLDEYLEGTDPQNYTKILEYGVTELASFNNIIVNDLKDMNEKGEVVADGASCGDGVFLKGRDFYEIPFMPYSINNEEVIAGIDCDFETGIVYNAYNNQVTEYSSFLPLDINDDGHMVGYKMDTGFTAQLYRNGTFLDLTEFSMHMSLTINNSGVVLGSGNTLFLYNDGIYESVSDVRPSPFTMNDSGDVSYVFSPSFGMADSFTCMCIKKDIVYEKVFYSESRYWDVSIRQMGCGDVLIVYDGTSSRRNAWVLQDGVAFDVSDLIVEGIMEGEIAEAVANEYDQLFVKTITSQGIEKGYMLTLTNQDVDNDGLSDYEEYELGSELYNPDTDGDGMPDGWEVHKGLNPLMDDADEDVDGDGLTNTEEYVQGTDPLVYDTFYGMTVIYESDESLVTWVINDHCDVAGYASGGFALLDGEFQDIPLAATDMNNYGDICGIALSTLTTSMIYKDGVASDIPMSPPYDAFYAWEINDDGLVLGDDSASISSPTMQIYESGVLSVPGVVAPYLTSRVGSINDEGQLVAVVNDGSGDFLLIGEGTDTVAVVIAETDIVSCDNNNHGEVVWSDGFSVKLYSNGIITELTQVQNNEVALDEYHRVYIQNSVTRDDGHTYTTTYQRYVYEEGHLRSLPGLMLHDVDTQDVLTPPNSYGQLAMGDRVDDVYTICIFTPINQDTDGDGLTDYEEMELGTLLYEVDTDGDGVNDGDEVANGTDPLVSDLVADTDGDGLSDSLEEQLGTDPLNSDTDGDGLIDGDEVLVYQTYALLADSDGDGLDDGREIALGCDPMDAASKPVNLALTAFPYGTNLTNPQVLNDGVMSSYCYHWDRVAFTAWQTGDMRYDLGENCMISSMKMLFYSCDGQGYKYYIQASSESEDGPWTIVYTQSNKMKNWQTMTFDIPVSARYLRLKCTGVHNARKGLAVVEWQVMGCYR